jgi:predicted transposase YbfD/YdcC
MPDQEWGYVRHFAELPDPRCDRTKKHSLHDILGVTLCAVICGADRFEEIERFGEARSPWLREFFPLPNGVPSHDTFNRVLAALDRKRFAGCFGRWMADRCEAKGLKAIAIDGKACRSAAGDTVSGCLHLVSAWATENGLVLGQEAVADGSHEITATPAHTTHYYITSSRAGAGTMAGRVRGHWGVENGLHWCLDVSFGEDANRTRDKNAGANLGMVRRVAASLLKQDPKRGSTKAKRLTAAWDGNYLRQVLQGLKPNEMR